MMRPLTAKSRPQSSGSCRVSQRPATGVPLFSRHSESDPSKDAFNNLLYPPDTFSILLRKGLAGSLPPTATQNWKSSRSLNPASFKPVDSGLLERVRQQLGSPNMHSFSKASGASTSKRPERNLSDVILDDNNNSRNLSRRFRADDSPDRLSPPNQNLMVATGFQKKLSSFNKDSQSSSIYQNHGMQAGGSIDWSQGSASSTIKRISSTQIAISNSAMMRKSKIRRDDDVYIEAGKVKKYGPKKIVRDESVPRLEKFQFKEIDNYLDKYKSRLAERMKNAGEKKYRKVWEVYCSNKQA